jgi:hypothetical protein
VKKTKRRTFQQLQTETHRGPQQITLTGATLAILKTTVTIFYLVTINVETQHTPSLGVFTVRCFAGVDVLQVLLVRAACRRFRQCSGAPAFLLQETLLDGPELRLLFWRQMFVFRKEPN